MIFNQSRKITTIIPLKHRTTWKLFVFDLYYFKTRNINDIQMVYLSEEEILGTNTTIYKNFDRSWNYKLTWNFH